MFVSVLHEGGGAWAQTRRNQGTTSGQMGGVSGPRGASEEPREDQRARVQRGKTVNTVTVYLLSGGHTWFLYQMCVFSYILVVRRASYRP